MQFKVDLFFFSKIVPSDGLLLSKVSLALELKEKTDSFLLSKEI